ncbi:hypothetical protein MD484_g5046, partial [Candolleomyces efflorescens]
MSEHSVDPHSQTLKSKGRTAFDDAALAGGPFTEYAPRPSNKDDSPQGLAVETDREHQTAMREVIVGQHMNYEIWECTIEDFIQNYLPQHEFATEAIVNAGLAKAREYLQESFPFQKEAGISDALKAIVAALLDARDECSKGQHLRYVSSPNQIVVSCVEGGNFQIDGSLSFAEGREALHSTSIVVAMGFEVERNYESMRRNRRQLVSAIVHIMNDDVRRTFMFGITIEGRHMNVWYFSRSHSMKAQSFDYVEHPEILVKLLTSLVFADRKDLGFDPNITLKSGAGHQYIYTVDGAAGKRRFLTTHCLFESRAFNVAGRMTRVFRVEELEGTADSSKKGAKPMVLKDVWLDKDAEAEMGIQAKLFGDIQRFAENKQWRTDPRLSGFVDGGLDSIVDDFGELLQEERYKDLFLLARDGSTGECSKPLLESSAWPPRSDIFFGSIDLPLGDEAPVTSQRMSQPHSGARDLQTRQAGTTTLHVCRRHAPKRRSFVIFDEECTRVYCLPTVGDVFNVLSECITALLLMFCAGWVHRDISCNNVMAIQDPTTKRWKLKLADLEYSKPFGANASTSDPNIGTPFFMPCEILCRQYFGLTTSLNPFTTKFAFITWIKDRSNRPHHPKDIKPPLLHNFLHDLEAIFWTGLWIITSRVNHEPSRLYGLNIFQNSPKLELTQSRRQAFEYSIEDVLSRCLQESLVPLADLFEQLRISLYTSAISLGRARSWLSDDGIREFSELHMHFALVFDVLKGAQHPWASVKLQPATDSIPRPMAPRAHPNAEKDVEQKKQNKVKKVGERLPCRVIPQDEEGYIAAASGRKRSRREGEQANDGGERRSGSKRLRSTDGGQVSASGVSGTSTSAEGDGYLSSSALRDS